MAHVKPGTIGQLPQEREILQRAIDQGLVDVLRSTHQGVNDLFTWWAPWRNLRDKNVGWRIDFVLVAESLAKKGATCLVRKDVLGSDHAPVVVELAD